MPLYVDGDAVPPVTVTGTVTAEQPDPTLLNTTAFQPDAADLNATVIGTVTVEQGTAANLLARVSQPTAADLNATVAQGTAAALAGAWPVEVTNGTSVAAVKPATTAPLASDPALVVTLSPNSAPITAPSAVSVIGPLSSFGELLAVPPTPTTQGAFVYNINSDDWQTITYGAGAGASAAGGLLSVASGTGTSSYALVQSLRTTVYRPGQGVLTRFTALFDAGAVGHRQLGGIGNPESGYYFGYVDDVFGILHVDSGTRAIQKLTITTKSSTVQNVAVTLDGTTVLVPVTNGANINATSYEIAKGDYSQCGANGWDAQALDGVVTFVARQCNAVVGTVSVTGTTVVGVGAVVTARVANTEAFIPQASWNGAALATPLDTSKVNVFQIGWQYLGGGDAFFYVEEKTTGRFVLVHTIRNANSRTTPVLRQPSARVQWISRNTGTASSIIVKGLSAAVFLEGVERSTSRVFAASVQKSSTLNVLTPIISLEPLLAYQSRANAGQVRVSRVSIACSGAKPTTFYFLRSASINTSPNYTPVNLNTSYSAVDSAATTVSGGLLLFATSLGKDASVTEDVSDISIVLDVGQSLTIASISTANSDVSAAITWLEE